MIFLDHNNRFVFNNRRAAQDFLVRISQEMDKAILLVTEELNKISELCRLYYLTDKDYKFKFKIKESLDLISNRLAWLDEHEGSLNHDSIAFGNILTCLDELISSYGLLAKKAIQRKDTLTKRRASLRIDLIKLYMDQFLGIGIKPSKLVTPLVVVHKVS